MNMHVRTFVAIIWTMISMFAVFAGDALAEKRIGVFMFSEETRYMEGTRGFKDSLAENGFGEDKVKYFLENAGGNKARAAEVAKQFSEQKLDMIVSLGTSATVVISREIKDVPVVFSSVYDPVDAGVANSWGSSGNNTTGNSPNIPMSKIVDTLKSFASIKKLAVLYTPGEKNSEAQLRDLQKIQEKQKIKIVPVRLTKKEDIDQLLPTVLRSVDALFLTGANPVSGNVLAIVDMATKAKVITITHLEDLVEKGVLMGVSADPYALGRLAGLKAVKIFKGAKPSSIPIEKAAKNDVLLNMITAKKGSFVVSAEFMKNVARKIE